MTSGRAFGRPAAINERAYSGVCRRPGTTSASYSRMTSARPSASMKRSKAKTGCGSSYLD